MEDKNQLTVVKSNKVIEASYMLSLAEQRVLLACIAMIDSKGPLTESRRFEVTAADVADLVGLDSLTSAYRDLKATADRLFERSVLIDDPDPDNPEIEQRKTRWISSIDYIPGEGKLVLSFSIGIIPYISALSRGFTKYKLKHVARFQSVYSIRLYELLIQWSSFGEREIALDWLKSHLMVENKYPRLVDFKKRVIDMAIKEINEHSNLWVKYDQVKSGRNVTHFKFQFGINDKVGEHPKLKKEIGYISEDSIKKKARPGETRMQVIDRLKGESLNDFAKPGETSDQAINRKKAIAALTESRKILGSVKT